MSVHDRAPRAFTGRHMAAILIAFFTVVIAVNVMMARYAVSTFGGLVVDNSYVASQQFNGWLAKARKEKALGWSVDLRRGRRLHLEVTLSDADGPLTSAQITALARHPLGGRAERDLTFRPLGNGRYESRETLPPGRWIVHVKALARGRAFNHLVDLR